MWGFLDPHSGYESSRAALRSKLIDCVHYGRFTLSSGKESSFYIDVRPVILDREGLQLITNCFRQLMKMDSILARNLNSVTALACPEGVGSTVMLGAMLREIKHFRAHGVVVRKDRKEHGTMDFVEGGPVVIDNLLLIDDVITTGQTITDAIIKLDAKHAKIYEIFCVVNRSDEIKLEVDGKEYYITPLFDYAELIDPRRIK